MSRRTRTWARFALILVVVLLSLSVVSAQDAKPEPVGLRPDAPQYALHGPYWVGTREFVIEPDSDRPLPLTVWYPALNPDGKPQEVNYVYENFVSITGFTQAGHAIVEAVPDTTNAPYPLVIVSHGLAVYRYAHAYLAEHLASYGFVVMAIDHTGDTLGNVADPQMRKSDWSGFVEGMLTGMVNRPDDIQREIDYATVATQLAGLIDIDQIAVLGHSFGGYTALASAGAQVDLSTLPTWCSENAQNKSVTSNSVYGILCQILLPAEQNLLKMRGLDTKPGEVWQSFDVSGVDAVVAIAPSPVFTTKSFDHVAVPAMVMVGTGDFILTYEEALMAYQNLPSDQKSLVSFNDAEHNISVSACQQWFYEYQALGDCAVDPVWDVNRAHDLINHFTTAFLLDVLKGDKDAHAALAPDAVSFPGIEYQAEGF